MLNLLDLKSRILLAGLSFKKRQLSLEAGSVAAGFSLERDAQMGPRW